MMLFYFSGTGNSFYAARRLGRGRELNCITDCVQEETFAFSPAPDEAVGFVCPVVFGGLPAIVLRFLDRLCFDTKPAYLYVVKVGDHTHFADRDYVAAQLSERGFSPDAVFSLDMPGNCTMYYELSSPQDEAAILAQAANALDRVREAVAARRPALPPAQAAVCAKERALLETLYDRERRTDNFTMLDTCIGCATCAGRCPEQAIVMHEGLPTWRKERCSLCMACMRCGAIVHGKTNEGRKRYTHPDLRKQKCH